MERNIISTRFNVQYFFFVSNICFSTLKVTHVQPSKIFNLRDVFISVEYKLNDADNLDISKETIMCFVQVKKSKALNLIRKDIIIY